LIGVSAAVMIGGLVMGSLLPQVIATVNLFDLKSAAIKSDPVLQLVDAVFILVGTISTLMYFYFGARVRPNLPPQRSRLVAIFAQIGQVFIGITLGALFAGVYSAALAALIERVSSIWNFIKPLLG
jgi:Na+/proline symporter